MAQRRNGNGEKGAAAAATAASTHSDGVTSTMDASCTLASLLDLPTDHDTVRRAQAGLIIDNELRDKLLRSPGRGLMPGSIVTYDYSNLHTSSESIDEAAARIPKHGLRLLQWNIERGYKMDEIIAELKKQDADVIALQEIDIGCERSGWRDTGREIAQALGMHYACTIEFIELYSPMRPTSAQGGGVHGNALLSRWPLHFIRPVPHTIVYDWESRGDERSEPRLGGRYTLTAQAHIPGFPYPIQIYSAHLETFCGIIGRLKQFAEILRDAERVFDGSVEYETTHPSQVILSTGSSNLTAPSSSKIPATPFIAVFGDFNTLSHGIARCSASYCNDSLRIRSLGWTEAEWWVKNVLTVGMDEASRLDAYASELSAEDRATLRNPGFIDPFDAYDDCTLWNYNGWFQGKLDWMLMKNLTATSQHISNTDYCASDHALMACTVMCDRPHRSVEASKSDDHRHVSSISHRTTATSISNSTTLPITSRRRSARIRRALNVSKHESEVVEPDSPTSSPAITPVSTAALAEAETAPTLSLSSSSMPLSTLYPVKSSSFLRASMPLRRMRPGVIISSTRNPAIYVTQLTLFWGSVLALLMMLYRWSSTGIVIMN